MCFRNKHICIEKHTTMKKIIPISIATLICFGVGLSANYFQSDAIVSWYPHLIKSSLTPPNIVFPIAWSIIYLCMGISIGIVWDRPSYTRRPLTWLFSWQLILNFTWSIMFFAMKSPILGLFNIIILDIFVYLYAKHVYRINKISAWLFAPYILWLILATYLNAYIFFAN